VEAALHLLLCSVCHDGSDYDYGYCDDGDGREHFRRLILITA
jgi:hypothetical protein